MEKEEIAHPQEITHCQPIPELYFKHTQFNSDKRELLNAMPNFSQMKEPIERA
jgi:hypothetical protein